MGNIKNTIGDDNVIGVINDGEVVGNLDVHVSKTDSGVAAEPQSLQKKQFTLNDFLTWAQIGQFLLAFFSVVIGVAVTLMAPRLFPDGLPDFLLPREKTINSTDVD